VVIRILERANPTVVGAYRRSGREEWVEPDDRRLPPVAVRQGSLGALSGEKVVVAIAKYPSFGHPQPFGSVVERLGPAGEPDAETLAIIRRLDLRDAFPAEVLAEADLLPPEVTSEERRGRLDLTGETVFTIDDADARDLDDAISLADSARDDHRGSQRAGVWRLGVHIADVAHYVVPDSALDREARERGTSVYLSDRVLPMFPTRLSNGIASLHPGVDRLTVSVFMNIDLGGRVLDYDIRRSVIRSAARLTYDAVASLPRAEPEPSVASDVAAVLREMAILAARLRQRRMDRGSLDFDLAEEKVMIDGEGHPLEIVRRQRNVATQLIEEFMIVANETVADHLLWTGAPFIARVHEEPFPDDLAALREMLAPLGYRVPTTRAPRPGELQAILEASRGRPEAEEVHRALLRALPQARYSAARSPHFALASANYLHFTSPIRRYPDLVVHRQVVAEPNRERAGGELAHRFQIIAETCSRAERTAERAETESLDLMKARLALACLGDIENGEVVDVFEFGAFVRLPNGVEGLVPTSATPRGGLRLGQPLRVQVVRVDVAKRHVDLVPV
jgi:ribonuclease R